MKKITNFILLSLLAVLLSYGQQQSGGDPGPDTPIDLIVLVDTSTRMSGYFREFLEFAPGLFLREFLRIGDTFHILSFSDNPATEIVRRIEGVGDVETIIGRLHLLYPLGSGPDLNKALDYAGSYIAALPNRPRKLVLFTAWPETVQFALPGTDFYLIRFPLNGPPPSSNRPPRPSPVPAQPPVQAPAQPAQTSAQTQPAAQAARPPAEPAQTPGQTQPTAQPAPAKPQDSAPAQSAQTPPRQQPPTQTQAPTAQTASARPPQPDPEQPAQTPERQQPPARSAQTPPQAPVQAPTQPARTPAQTQPVQAAPTRSP
ncbi:MAG: VWA domain-containing protein, partial [Treponema sp.]|nr:VWA domain-containing protein [Treponema sp.]